MRSGICPKCGSSAVHTRYGGIYRGTRAAIDIGGFGVRHAESDDYVCVDCGYFEQYFTPGRVLDKIARKWPRVDEVIPDELLDPDEEFEDEEPEDAVPR